MTSIQKRTRPEVELGPDVELGYIIKSTTPHRGRLPTLLQPFPKSIISLSDTYSRFRIILDEPGKEFGAIDFVGKHLLAAELVQSTTLCGIHRNQLLYNAVHRFRTGRLFLFLIISITVIDEKEQAKTFDLGVEACSLSEKLWGGKQWEKEQAE